MYLYIYIGLYLLYINSQEWEDERWESPCRSLEMAVSNRLFKPLFPANDIATKSVPSWAPGVGNSGSEFRCPRPAPLAAAASTTPARSPRRTASAALGMAILLLLLFRKLEMQCSPTWRNGGAAVPLHPGSRPGSRPHASRSGPGGRERAEASAGPRLLGGHIPGETPVFLVP